MFNSYKLICAFNKFEWTITGTFIYMSALRIKQLILDSCFIKLKVQVLIKEP